MHTKFVLSVLILAMALVTGCGDSSSVLPTSPSAAGGGSSVTAPTGDDTNGGGTTGTSSAVQRCGREDVRMDIYEDSGQFRPRFGGNTITLAVENVSQSACELTFTSWDRNNGSSIVLTDGQVLVDGQRYLLPAGQQVVMGPLRVPEGCYQLDVSNAGGQPIPDRADRLDAIRWHTGGTCQPTSPPPGEPDPRVCTAGLSLTASYANGLVTLESRTSAPVSSRALRVWHRTDQGPIVEASAMLGQAATLPFAQGQQAHTMAVRASYVGDDRATCSAETTVIIPPGPPPPATCANTTTDLNLFTNPGSASQVTGYLLTTLTGDGISGQLTVDGTVTTASNGARTPFTFDRPPAGSSPLVKIATLRSAVHGDACGERTVRITVEPRAAACAGVVVGLALVPDSPTATAISGHLISTLRGTGVTGELVLDGVTTRPADGEQTPYRFSRPAFGVPPVVRTATLRGMVGGEVCGTQSVLVTAPPQGATCENSVTRLQLVPGPMSATEVTGTLRTTVQGAGTTGLLTTFDGASVAAADNGSFPYQVARPPYGSAPLRLTATLRTSTGGSPCGVQTVTIDVPPQDPPPTCVGARLDLQIVEGAGTPTEATGYYRVTMTGGVGVVGHLTLPNGSTVTVSDGDTVPYRYARPPAGSEPLAYYATLRTLAGGTPCGELRVRLKVQP